MKNKRLHDAAETAVCLLAGFIGYSYFWMIACLIVSSPLLLAGVQVNIALVAALAAACWVKDATK